MINFEAHMAPGRSWTWFPNSFWWQIDGGTEYGYSSTPVQILLGAGEHTINMLSEYAVPSAVWCVV
jgi:hypothetical protein